MAQSVRYRILSVFLLLAIVVPAIPVSASFQDPPSAEAAEVGPAQAGREEAKAAPLPDFTVPRPVEDGGSGDVMGSDTTGDFQTQHTAVAEGTALPIGVSADWWSAIREDLERSEYQVTWQEKTDLPDVSAAYQAPNRANNLRTYFTPAGIRVIPRTGTAQSWQWGLSLIGYGYEGAVRPAALAELTAASNRVEYSRGEIVEWYVNDEHGLEQGFTIATPPAPTYAGAPLQIDLALSGNMVSMLAGADQSIGFRSPEGVLALRYGDLRAYDAVGRPLAARFLLSGSLLSIRIDTTGAIYPLAVNPTVSRLAVEPDWAVQFNQAGAKFGFSVGTAGDVNDDGFDDVIVGAPEYDPGVPNVGAVFVYHGGENGLPLTYNWSAVGTEENSWFGISVGTAGNINGEEGGRAFDDVIVGANGANWPNGAAFVYLGSADGLGSTPIMLTPGPEGSFFGSSVATAGDVNNDGLADVVVGDPGYGDGNRGAVFLYFGSQNGPVSTQILTHTDGFDFGVSVGAAGDINGDSYDDVIVGDPNYRIYSSYRGRAYVFLGTAQGLVPTPHWMVEGSDQDNRCNMGESVGTAGDVNGDGFADVIVGAPDWGGFDKGAAFVYLGSDAGLTTTASWTGMGTLADGDFGNSVGTAGDVNGDGYDDIVVGEPCLQGLESCSEGNIYVWYGSAVGIAGSAALSDTGAAGFGSSVGTAGDVNGDGLADIIVGDPYYSDGGYHGGAAFAYYGTPATYPLLDTMCNTDGPSCALNGACCGAQYWIGGAINTANGNHVYKVTDLSVPTIGGEIAFARIYASQHATVSSVLGYGWTHNFAMGVYTDAAFVDPGYVIVTAPDGSWLYFRDHGDGTYTSYPGVQATLEFDSPHYILTDSTQAVYYFNQGGLLTEVRDPQGRAVSLIYEQGLLHTVQSTEGSEHFLHLSYTGGRLTGVEDDTGRGVSFAYDGNGNPSTVVDTRGYTWTYTYSGTHLLYEVIDPNGHTVERTKYDPQGRAIQQWEGAAIAPALEIEFLGEATRVIADALEHTQTVFYDGRRTYTGTKDAAGSPITRTYDADFNLTYVQDANGNPTAIDWSACGCRPEVITDALGNDTRMLYDLGNNLISTTDALEHTTLYTYSNGTVPPNVPANLLVETRDALDQHTYYTYSTGPNPPAGLLIRTKGPGGRETRNHYDSYGQLLSTAALSGGVWITLTGYTYDTLGRQIGVTDAANHVNMTYYDGGGYVTRTVANCTAGSYQACRAVAYNAAYPDENIVTGYAYDGIGNRMRVTNTLGIVTAYEYDAANRLIAVTENHVDGQYDDEYPDEDIRTGYGYDAAGNQVVVTDSAGLVTRTFYDELNRPVTVTRNYVGGGQYAPYDPQYPDRNVSTFYGYDPAGNQVTVTNPLGMVTLTGYDQLNRPAIITQNYTTTTPNPDPATYNLVTRYSYNAVGNQARVTDPRGVATCYEYDELNRVSAVAENCVDLHGLPGPLNVTTYYGYDAAGQRIWVRNPQDVVTRYEYDDLGRLVAVVENSVVELQGTGDEDITTRYRYDLLGNRTRVIDPLGTVTRQEYDGLNRVIRTTANYGMGIHSPDRNVVTAYRYDGLGRRTAVVDDHEVVTRYNYDALGRLVQVWENYVDLSGQGNDWNVRTAFAYDRWGNRTAVTDPGNHTTHYEYDALSRLITVTDALDHNMVYRYDAGGNRTGVIDANENATAYAYDLLGRVVRVEDALGNATTYLYDAAGNRTGVIDAEGIATRYDYDALGRLIAVTENYIYLGPVNADTNVVTAYGYDLLGNLATITNARGYTTTYAYDALARLTAERDPLGHTWEYAYDALSRRIVLTDASGIVTTYAYDALSRLRAVDHGEGQVQNVYAYDSLGRRTAMTDVTGVTQYAYDDLGRVTGLTHTVDAIVAYTLGYRYDARGLRTGLVYPDGAVISYTYDAAARLTGVLEGAASYAFYTYDPAGRLAQTSMADGVVAQYDYDTVNHLAAITYQKRAGIETELLARYGYAYDRVGNRTRAVETVIAAGGGGQAAVPTDWNPAAATAPDSRLGAGVVWARLAGLLAPLPQGQPPIVRERGSYSAVFDAHGLRFSPRHLLYGGAEHEVAYRLTVVRRGNDVILHPGHEDPVLIGDDLVQYWRGEDFAEEYALTASGVEQRFLFLAPMVGEGDLIIEGNLTGDLHPALEPNTGEITFRVPGTDEVVASYGRAIVQDATGRRLQATLELNGAHLRIVVPGDWLARAVYPVVVDPLIGANFAVSTQPIADDQERAAVAYGGRQSYLVTWQGPGDSGDDIYAQVVSYTGALVSGTVVVITGTNDQSYPAAAGNPADGSYLVAWQSYDPGAWSSHWNIYARLVYSDGTWGSAAVAVYTGTNDQQHPAVAFNVNDGEYLVVWDGYSSSVFGIYGQVIEADGTLSGAAVTIYTSTYELSFPDVTFNVSDTEYLVVWQEYMDWDEILSWSIRGRVVAVDGSAVTAVLDVATTTTAQTVPNAAYNVSDTQYLVVWQSYVDGSSRNDIQGRRVDRQGQMLDQLPLGIATGSSDQRAPAVTWGEELSEYLVTWEGDSSEGVGWDVWGRRVSRAGAMAGDPIAVYTGTQEQRYAAVAYNGAAAEYLVAWQDYRSGSHWDIYAQRVGVGGDRHGEEVLVSAEAADYGQTQPAAAYGATQRTHLVVWQDGRGIEYHDIYGQFVGGGGALVGAAMVIAGEIECAEESPAIAYAADHDEYLVVWQEYDVGERKRKIAGQRVTGDGTMLGERLEIGSGAGTRGAPAVAYNAATGYYLVVWEDSGNGNEDVYARAVRSGDGQVGPGFVVAAGGTVQQAPAVAADESAGKYLVVWQEHGMLTDDIYARPVGVTQTLGPAFGVSTAVGDQQHPAVAWSREAHEYLVVYRHRGGSDDEIRGRIVDVSGSRPPSPEFTIAGGAGERGRPAVARDAGGGGYVVAWEEGANSPDIYARALDGDGTLWGGVETFSAAGNAQVAPALSYDSSRGRFLAVWADHRHGVETPDVYGQLYKGYSLVVNYTYDGLYRLVGAAYSDGAAYGYAYDAVGNRTRYTNATAPVTLTTYTYDAADRLTAVTRAGVVTPYTWSERGELLADGVQSYAWDAAGRLVGVSVAGGPEVGYAYDGANHRVGMVVNGVMTTYVVDPFNPVDAVPQVLRETTGEQSTRNLYGLDLLGAARDGIVTYYGYDALSVRLRLAEDGAIAATYRYGPYGEVVGEGPAGYGYTGETHDGEVRLLYLRARYYMPETGRFISRDLWFGDQVWPVSLQRFVYAANNPIGAVDPSGLQATRSDILPGFGMMDGGLYGLLFAQAQWWFIDVPPVTAGVVKIPVMYNPGFAYTPSSWDSAGLESHFTGKVGIACGFYNSDVSGAGWQTTAIYEGFTSLPNPQGYFGEFAVRFGAVGMSQNPPSDIFCAGSPASRQVYHRMRIDTSGYAHVAGADTESPEFDYPASLYIAPATSYVINRQGFRRWDPLGPTEAIGSFYNPKGKMYYGDFMVNVGRARAGLAHGMNALALGLEIASAPDVFDRKYQVLLQRKGVSAQQRAIIRTYYASNGTYTIHVTPHFLGMQSGTWVEWPMLYPTMFLDNRSSYYCSQAMPTPCLWDINGALMLPWIER